MTVREPVLTEASRRKLVKGIKSNVSCRLNLDDNHTNPFMCALTLYQLSSGESLAARAQHCSWMSRMG